MISLDKAVQVILSDLTPLELETIPIEQAHGRVLGKTIKSETDIPKFNQAAIDGYALNASETSRIARNKPSVFKLAGESKPGKPYLKSHKRGEAIKVSAGVRLPDGYDSVVKYEDAARPESNKLNVYTQVQTWRNVIRAGREISAGGSIMPAGRILNAADVARLVEVGLTEIEVYKKPRIGLISVGDEFLSNYEEEKNPSISRNQFVGSIISETGGEFVYLGACTNSLDQLEEKLSDTDGCDNVIIMANQSIDHYNFLKTAFRELKMDLKFWRVAIKPGKSVLFGVRDGKPVFGISGNLWATVVVLDLLVKPLLAVQSGLSDGRKLEVIARLTKELRTNPAMTQIFKAIVRIEPNGLAVTPILDKSLGELRTLSMANGYIIVPPQTSNIRAGEKVRVEVFGPLEQSKSLKPENH